MRYFLAGTCATIIKTLFLPAQGRNVTVPAMPSTNLTVLLDLRRAAQDDAKRVLGEAVTNLARTEAEQGRLEALLAQAEQALASGSRGFPADAAEGLARERFRQRQLARREQARCQAR